MVALSDPTATDRPDATTTCPLCDRDEVGEQDLYVHLQVNHRKSTLSEVLVEIVDDGATSFDPPSTIGRDD